jgi:Bacitracin resistance protein BacA
MVEVCTRGVDTGFVALGYVKVAVLGVVQGITELLPISSTAHMRLVPAVLGWQDPGSAFSAAMQLAALAAVVSYFWSDVRGLAVNSFRANGACELPGGCPSQSAQTKIQGVRISVSSPLLDGYDAPEILRSSSR